MHGLVVVVTVAHMAPMAEGEEAAEVVERFASVGLMTSPFLSAEQPGI